ncbi:hypothetical protein CJF42_14045 [Pseudoalteromonas sp. NBT06-2]|uniref:DUF6491 family protein n=1 Tax=Pseudoalteromonas sp. NBT06-2 TaxID=2025950 RepID=UPI000BA68E7C|nr:DUF6491 family protein [Pseudoalteromonas sp. NBT06-2]PAJ73764.1 hypothetical protein CJF42_14045 [Pseudoalteromonas sp. NBT06-2]
MKKILVSTLVSAFFLMGCQTNPDTNKQETKPDIRIGEEVNQICFARSINGWEAVDKRNDVIVLNKNVKDKYILSLAGICDPQWAMSRIGTVSRGNSSCLSRGDKIITDNNINRNASCTIMKINKWHPEKHVEQQPTQAVMKTAED